MQRGDDRSIRATSGLLSAAAAVALVLGAGAPGDAAAQSADWQKVWNETVAAANKEGAVACGCPRHPGSRKFLLTQWAKDYPQIKLEYTGAKLPEWPARVEAERSAGKYLWDVFFTGPGPEIYRLAGNKVFDPLVDHMILPEVKNPDIWGGWDEAFYDNEKKRMFSFWQNVSVPQYNAALVPPADVESRQLEVLFDPKYKGKTVWWDPRVGGSGSNSATFVYLRFGEEGLKKLLVDQQPVFLRDVNQIAERMVRGTAAIAIGPQLDEVLKQFSKAGVKFDIRTFPNNKSTAYASTSYGILSIFSRAAHPNAATVFVNWLLSKDVQIGLGKAAEQISRRNDIEATAAGKLKARLGEQYVNLQREEYLQTKRKAMALARKLRPQ